jgi:hypothetical protein
MEHLNVIGRLADRSLRSLGQRLIYVEAPHVMLDAAQHDYALATARPLMVEEYSVL